MTNQKQRITRQDRRVMAALAIVEMLIDNEVRRPDIVKDYLGSYELDETDLGQIETELLGIGAQLYRRRINRGYIKFRDEKKQRSSHEHNTSDV